ncbi:hypothetical protein [Paenibacillus sp. 1781tsa1]|uniref:hypothetical protein n=1 Tax=Paenibacillus sp. 1781tsa1 TaxID=2953810 RepID=UPI00209CB909|nr:hypothetical protein [Paenibacillus sp. 1781tsa1]MCP1182366.1 hypothetical protein [Paenibacillus sp. 1781tsa1]
MLFIVFFIAIVFGTLLIFRMDEDRRLKAGALTVVVFSILLCMLLIFQMGSYGGDSFSYLGFFNMSYGAANVWVHIFIVMTLVALLTYLGASE